MPPDTCSIKKCPKAPITRGWCKAHYSKWYKYGDPLATRRVPAEERFWAKVDIGSIEECWEWDGSTGGRGYGRFRFNGSLLQAHRFSFELCVGEIPVGYEVDHLCRNVLCVNPNHLEAVTPEENRRRRILPNRFKTSCKYDHPFNEVNTYHWRGKRQCRICHNTRERIRRGERNPTR